MKKYPLGITQTALVLGSASLIVGAATVHAQDLTTAQPEGQSRGLYLSGDVGVNLASDMTSSLDSGQFEKLNPGVRADISLGYAFRLCDHLTLAPELEVGFTYNSFDTGQDDGENTSGGGDIVQVPITINGVLNWQFSPKWSVYGGIGLGASYNYVTISDNVNSVSGGIGGLAVEAKLGVQYKLGPGQIGLGYQYLDNEPVWLNPISNHTVFLSYTIYF